MHPVHIILYGMIQWNWKDKYKKTSFIEKSIYLQKDLCKVDMSKKYE